MKYRIKMKGLVILFFLYINGQSIIKISLSKYTSCTYV